MEPLRFWKNERPNYERTADGIGAVLPVLKSKKPINSPTHKTPVKTQPGQQKQPLTHKPYSALYLALKYSMP